MTSYIYVFQNMVFTKNKILYLILHYMEYLLFNIFNKKMIFKYIKYIFPVFTISLITLP